MDVPIEHIPVGVDDQTVWGHMKCANSCVSFIAVWKCDFEQTVTFDGQVVNLTVLCSMHQSTVS